jgi:hypothetical protein
MTRLNQNVLVGIVLIVLALAIDVSAYSFFAELAILLFFVGIVFVGYGAWKSIPDRNFRPRMAVAGVSILIGFAAFFVFMPVMQAPGPCMGGLACVHDYSLSCSVFGFGSYTTFYGRYFLTSDCSGFT